MFNSKYIVKYYADTYFKKDLKCWIDMEYCNSSLELIISQYRSKNAKLTDDVTHSLI